MGLHIAMLGWEFPPTITGGLGVHCFELVSTLGELGVRVDLYLPLQRSTPVSPHPNVRIIQVGGGNGVGAYGRAFGNGVPDNYSHDLVAAIGEFAVLSLSALKASGTRYDLVHCHDWLTIPAGMMAKSALGIPLVLTMHSTEYDRNPVPWSWISGIEALGVKTADRIIAVSGRMKALLVEKFHADFGKVRVVYNGIDVAKYRGKAGGIRREKLVLFLGRLTHQKGPEQFLRAAKKVHQHDGSARFLVVGEGGLLPKLISLSIELGIHPGEVGAFFSRNQKPVGIRNYPVFSASGIAFHNIVHCRKEYLQGKLRVMAGFRIFAGGVREPKRGINRVIGWHAPLSNGIWQLPVPYLRGKSL